MYITYNVKHTFRHVRPAKIQISLRILSLIQIIQKHAYSNVVKILQQK